MAKGKITAAEKKVMAAMGRKGGKARAKKLTAEQRREIAVKGGKARQAKGKAKKEQTKSDETAA